MHECFRYSNTVKHWRASLRSVSILWELKISTEKCASLFCYPWNFSIPEIFLKHRRVPVRLVSELRPELFERISWRPPPPSKTQRVSTTKCFSTARLKVFIRISWINPLMQKMFSIREYSETLKGLSLEGSDTVRDEKIDKKLCYPFLFSIEFFKTGFFSETQMGSSTKFLGAVRQTPFDGKSWYPPFLL